jgi:hypothetical protein
MGLPRRALARARNWSYFNVMAFSPSRPVLPTSRPGFGPRTAGVWGGSILGSLLLLGALALWFHYGTAVFFETIAAGVSACF